jgi:hypothetical protein
MANIVPDSFKEELFEAVHNFSNPGGNVFRLALYSTVTAFTSTGTTAYTVTNEVSGTGYSAGGTTLSNLGVAVGQNISYVDFTDATFSTATITASCALI